MTHLNLAIIALVGSTGGGLVDGNWRFPDPRGLRIYTSLK